MMKQPQMTGIGSAGWRKAAGLMTLAVTLLLAAAVTPALAAAVKSEATGTAKGRPRIGLVLSGGGARGAAHIGVLKVLEELRVPVDYIAGTSMGSIVGGSYASGNTVGQMLVDITNIKSADLATDAPSRRDVPIRRKQDDLKNYIGPEVGFRGGKVLLPKGVVTGIGLEAVLRDLAKVKGPVDFDTLPIPFRACATDIEFGKSVVFRSGDLATVMRASMSVPGAIAPAEIDGKMLVDGGLTRNLPVNAAREMGADIVIAVNLGTPLMKREEIDSLLGVTGQMINILTEQNVQASLDSLRPDDILIVPELGDYSSTDFDHMPDTVPIGEAAARKVQERLARYSLPQQQYDEHRRKQKGAEAAAVKVINEIRVEGLKRVNPKVIAESMETQTGKPLDIKVVDADMRRLYGRGDFEHVGYRIIEEPNKQILVVDAVEKSWGPDYLRFGLGLSAESGGDAYFNLLGSYRKTWINSLGAEWKNEVQVGQSTRFLSEFYQPLSVNRYLFVAPMVEYDQHYVQIFQGDTVFAKYNNHRTTAGLDLGSQITKYGELRVGMVGGTQTFKLSSGPQEFAPSDERTDIGAVRARMRIDQLDSVRFPRSGYAATAEIFDSQKTLGARDNYTRWEADLQTAVSSGDNTVQLGLKGGGAIGSAPLPVYDQFSFGGFLRMSGYRTGQFYGDSLTFGRLIYYRKLSKAVLTEGVYAGVSLEAGRVGGPLVPGSPNDVQTSGALILAADTPLGPMYISYGMGEDKNRTFYFFLGRP